MMKLKLKDKYDHFFTKVVKFYYKQHKKKAIGINQAAGNRKIQVIVSFTSIPNRIDTVWITVESLLRQTYKPDKLILWLAEEEFQNVVLPQNLMNQMQRGLEIRFCDNLKSYKKFYFTMQEYPNALIVTVDDDIIYTEKMLEKLVKIYVKHPNCIVCHRSHQITLKKNRLIDAYTNWIQYKDRKIKEIPSYSNFFTGCGGTLFPAWLLNKEVLNKDKFLALAPTADDIWLNFMAWISGLPIVNTKGIYGNVITIEGTQNNRLTKINVSKKQNDKQIKAVLKQYSIDVSRYI